MVRNELRSTICLLFAIVCIPFSAQITLDSCYSAAEANYPLVKQYRLIEQSLGYTLDNASRNWWPQVQFTAKAQVQSDVTSLPFDLSKLGFAGLDNPKISKDQYAATVSLQQTIYDGGNTKVQKEAAKVQAETDRQQTRTSLYALRQRVNDLYFGILLTGEQLRINVLHQANLKLSTSKVESLIRGGMAHEADLDAIRVELLRAEQAAENYQATRKAYTAMLAQLTGLNISPDAELAIPQLPPTALPSASLGANRPENQWFAAQAAQIYVQQKQLDARLRPKLGLFAQGAYGRPGLNLLKNDFKLYGIAGLNLTWNISAFYTRKADKKLLHTQTENIRVAQEVFNYNLHIEATQRETELARYEQLLRRDDEIIRLRENIRRTSEAKLMGGTLTADDLVRDTHAEQQARLDRAFHEMQHLLAAYNLKFTRGE